MNVCPSTSTRTTAPIAAALLALPVDAETVRVLRLDTDYLPNTYQQRMEYRLQILRKVRAVGNRIPLDLLIYTRPEYEILTQDMSSFMKDVHDCGKVIYERAS